MKEGSGDYGDQMEIYMGLNIQSTDVNSLELEKKKKEHQRVLEIEPA